MEKYIKAIQHYNVRLITVTQDIKDIENIKIETEKAVIENCNIHIDFPQKNINSNSDSKDE